MSSLEALSGPISIRARLMEGCHFKAAVAGQGRSAEVVRLIRMAHLPHWIWLVEMQDRVARRQGQPCVIAEWVFDSTAHDDVPRERLASLLDGTSDAGEVGSGSAEAFIARSAPAALGAHSSRTPFDAGGVDGHQAAWLSSGGFPSRFARGSSRPLIGSRPDSWLPNRLPTARWSIDGGASQTGRSGLHRTFRQCPRQKSNLEPSDSAFAGVPPLAQQLARLFCGSWTAMTLCVYEFGNRRPDGRSPARNAWAKLS